MIKKPEERPDNPLFLLATHQTEFRIKCLEEELLKVKKQNEALKKRLDEMRSDLKCEKK